jgi:hypothetical protein
MCAQTWSIIQYFLVGRPQFHIQIRAIMRWTLTCWKGHKSMSKCETFKVWVDSNINLHDLWGVCVQMCWTDTVISCTPFYMRHHEAHVDVHRQWRWPQGMWCVYVCVCVCVVLTVISCMPLYMRHYGVWIFWKSQTTTLYVGYVCICVV